MKKPKIVPVGVYAGKETSSRWEAFSGLTGKRNAGRRFFRAHFTMSAQVFPAPNAKVFSSSGHLCKESKRRLGALGGWLMYR